MAETEVEGFLLQSWKNDYVVTGVGNDGSGGNGGSGWGTSIGCDAGKTLASLLSRRSSLSPAGRQLRFVGTSTGQDGGRTLTAGSTPTRGVTPRSPRPSSVLEGWAANQAPTTENER